MVLPLFYQNKDRSHEKDYINPIICGECGGFWAEFQLVASGLYWLCNSEQHHHKKNWNQQKDLGTESSAIEIQQAPFCNGKHEFESAEWFQCGSGDQYF